MARAEKALNVESFEETIQRRSIGLALRSLAAGALRVLGVVEEKRGSSGATEPLMRAAANVSRRDVDPTSLAARS